MRNYIVTAVIEFEAENEAEAQEAVIGMDLFDSRFIPVENVYVEIKEVKEIG